MVRFATTIFLFLITFQFGLKLSVIIYWSYNQKVIAEELCINKENVELDCCGKCYLNTQLEKTEPKETKSENIPENKLKLLESDLLFRNDTKSYLRIIHVLSQEIKSLIEPNYYSFLYFSNKFEPPDLLV